MLKTGNLRKDWQETSFKRVFLPTIEHKSGEGTECLCVSDNLCIDAFQFGDASRFVPVRDVNVACGVDVAAMCGAECGWGNFL